MSRFYLADDESRQPRLTGPIRMVVFSTRMAGQGKRRRNLGCACWQAWNADPRMEMAMARLRGSGSFYWFGAITALVAAERMLRDDPQIHQIKLETISGVEIGRWYR